MHLFPQYTPAMFQALCDLDVTRGKESKAVSVPYLHMGKDLERCGS